MRDEWAALIRAMGGEASGDGAGGGVDAAGASGAQGAQGGSGGVFGELASFGLTGAQDVQVFGEPERKAQRERDEAKAQAELLIQRSLFMRAFRCPVCGGETQVPAVKTSSVRVIRKDTDFMPYYKEPNPLYYFATFCKLCGFAAVPANVRNITARQRDLIREKVCPSWRFEKEYPMHYTPQVAIEIHKLALYNAVVCGDRNSMRAILALHIGWLYRILADAANEKAFLAMALEGFKLAFEKERGPVGGLDRGSQEYLIGELSRRTGDIPGALNWFKMALTDRETSLAIKEMARDQKDKAVEAFERARAASAAPAAQGGAPSQASAPQPASAPPPQAQAPPTASPPPRQ
jgi:uncharacterized protein (DUF2225 family)